MALLYLGDHDSNPSFAYPAFFVSFLVYALSFFHCECLVVIWYHLGSGLYTTLCRYFNLII